MIAVIHGRRGAVAWLLCALALTGCGRYYYSRSGAPPSLSHFDTDSLACIREVGVPSGNGQYALVTPEPYQRCMLARGWTREKRMEPVETGWYRGIERDDVVSLAEGVRQPRSSAGGPADATTREFCFRRHLELRSARHDAMADYQKCLAE
jgi:hypothetical protein